MDEAFDGFNPTVCLQNNSTTKHLVPAVRRSEQSPSPELVLLESLRADPSKNVRDSVANWLKDASKSNSDFALETARRWMAESSALATRQVVRRA
ncbi:MAG: hypothetical protein ACK58L_09630 [Planctomycetota bacterium]